MTPDEIAAGVHTAFSRLEAGFGTITRRAKARFANRDWVGFQRDSIDRLDLYPAATAEAVRSLVESLGPRARDPELWSRTRDAFDRRMPRERNAEVARTFYNSVNRRIFGTTGVRPELEYAAHRSKIREGDERPDLFVRRTGNATIERLVRDVLENIPIEARWRDRASDARAVAAAARVQLQARLGTETIDSLDVVRPVFYRNKGAYVVGRIRAGGSTLPFVLPLVHGDRGVEVDAVLLDEDEVSIVFSFTRSYFHVDLDRPRDAVAFLKSILPLKPVAELYTSLGLHKHGKTELYRSLRDHLDETEDRFVVASGDVGMVMTVFTLPSYDVVFKVIRDRFAPPKTTTKSDVRERYRFVFRRDRVGRLVDAQEFEGLEFERDRFEPELLAGLLRDAAESVRVVGGSVVIDHLYAERKMIPLNLYVRSSGPGEAREAILDYGTAIKDLAAADIFPGDFLLKNFGVTRHGRVVFYDYDELCLLTDCRFRTIPPSRTPEDEIAAEPWFTVSEGDVFPEEFQRFLGLTPELAAAFEERHGDLFDVAFWSGMQSRLRAGEIPDVFPYPVERRLARP